jgi:hypothetical protein
VVSAREDRAVTLNTSPSPERGRSLPETLICLRWQVWRAVFAIVAHFRVRRRTNRLLRRAFEFANLPFDKNADTFSGVIRCTSGRDVDSKTVSKWARALRYVARSKKPDIELSTFMKEAGGVNACANLYAKRLRQGYRP